MTCFAIMQSILETDIFDKPRIIDLDELLEQIPLVSDTEVD